MNKLRPRTGRVLLSDPFLKDPNFARTVVLLTNHSEEGTIGFVLNQPMKIKLRNLTNDDTVPLDTIFQGGPVELNTLHFLHTLGRAIPDSHELGNGIFWGGDYSEAMQFLRRNPDLVDHFHFYLGYSGWSVGQLEEEIEQDAWLVTDIDAYQVFHRKQPITELWKELVESFGGDYRFLSKAPIDPSLN